MVAQPFGEDFAHHFEISKFMASSHRHGKKEDNQHYKSRNRSTNNAALRNSVSICVEVDLEPDSSTSLRCENKTTSSTRRGGRRPSLEFRYPEEIAALQNGFESPGEESTKPSKLRKSEFTGKGTGRPS